MKNIYMTLLGLTIASLCANNEEKIIPISQGTDQMATFETTAQSVQKKVLKNGMTILVRQARAIPKVSLQLWYNVGSKDEKTGEKGIAHLIEHMIFKGTKTLSESDINEVVHKLSGVCNAFTSYDYTGYLFDMPTQNWKEVLPIMADCMVNCSFKEEHLNSEMKAVIQELKMRRDNYITSLAGDMLTAVFPDHPYHYPIIGYKQDLWNVSGKELHAFYKKHYLPNNATLVVIGDVQADEVFSLAENYFGSLTPNFDYKKEELYWNEDICSKGVKLYRDIQQPIVMLSFVVPGSRAQADDVLEITSYILGEGKSSRLYKKLVNELQVATSVETFTWDLFDHSLFFIYFEPSSQEHIDDAIKAINQEINLLATKGTSTEEITSALKKAQMKHYKLLEEIEQQAYEIGKYYLATQDENYIFKLYNQPMDSYKQAVLRLAQTYLRPTAMNTGLILPLPSQDKKEWSRLQHASDELDKQILSKRIRNSPVEPMSYAKKVRPHPAGTFQFPKPASFTLDNGLTVLAYNNATTAKINLVMELKAKHYYDPQDKQGLYHFVSNMMIEGTKKYPGNQFAQELESRGMSLSVYPGGISMSMLSEDFQKGLEFLLEMLTNATFAESDIKKVRQQLIAELKSFWDEPKQFAGQIVKEKIYANHPMSKNSIGSIESVTSITQNDLVSCYKKYITPDETTIAIIGDLQNYDVKDILKKTLGAWKGSHVEDIEFPTLKPIDPIQVSYPINRDQVVLYFAGLSIDRKDADYDKLLLFDQIFGGGVLGSMASKLFELREQSGLFYTINGSLIAQAGQQPGMVIIKTIVSVDRLSEAEQAIKNTIATVINTVTETDLVNAKQAVINSLVNNFETNSSTAQSFLFLHKYKFGADYFDKRAQELEKITLAQVKEAACKFLQNDKLLLVKVGRVEGCPVK